MVYVIPEWFFGYDIALNLLFGIITLIVSLYAFKVYKLSSLKQSKLFGLSFSFISISYFIQSFLTIILLSRLHVNKIISLASFTTWYNLALSLHILLFILGLVTLVYMTLNVNSKKIFSMILLLSLSTFLFTNDALHLFHFISAIVLVFIFYHYMLNLLNKKSLKNLLVTSSFGLIFISRIIFMVAVDYSIYYVIGDIIVLVAYLLILINLIIIIGKK
ncbi:MAG: hypothetical protein AABW52_00040 [Nanoarchaeota archaeon]